MHYLQTYLPTKESFDLSYKRLIYVDWCALLHFEKALRKGYLERISCSMVDIYKLLRHHFMRRTIIHRENWLIIIAFHSAWELKGKGSLHFLWSQRTAHRNALIHLYSWEIRGSWNQFKRYRAWKCLPKEKQVRPHSRLVPIRLTKRLALKVPAMRARLLSPRRKR